MITVQVGTLMDEGHGWETNTPCRQNLSEEFIERTVKGKEEGKRNIEGKTRRQGPACLSRGAAGREPEWAKLLS